MPEGLGYNVAHNCQKSKLSVRFIANYVPMIDVSGLGLLSYRPAVKMEQDEIVTLMVEAAIIVAREIVIISTSKVKAGQSH